MKRLILLIALVYKSLLVEAQSLEFIRNDGQWEGNFNYKAITGKGDVYLEPTGFTYLIGESNNNDKIDAYHHGQIKEKPLLNFHAFKVHFQNALTPQLVAKKEQSWYYNYFLGKNPSKWKSNIHPALAIDYQNLYKGIDMHVASEKGDLKYEFIVSPNADVNQIQLEYKGTDKLEIVKGNLLIHTSIGTIEEKKPYCYQSTETGIVEVKCVYQLAGNVISYSFPKGFDTQKPLIIDPVVVFSTFTGSTADNWGFTATYDQQGNFYAGGLVNGLGYPTTTGAFQITFGGGTSTSGSNYACDIAIMKLNPTGSNRIFATYIGGADNEQPHSMIVDAANNLIIAGRTYSANYPTTTGAFDTTLNGGADMVITKLKHSGDSLLASTYIGGSADDGVNYDASEYVYGELKHNYGDDARSEVLIDNSGNIYVTASTKSIDFPHTANAYQSILKGGQDAVVIKMNPNLTSMIYGTYLGGNAADAGYVLALDTNQSHFYVAGGTRSTDFPHIANTINNAYQGGFSDGFITKFDNSGSYQPIISTFIGMADYDQCYGVQVDYENNVYLMGQTFGGTFPITPTGVYSNPNSSQFILKLNPTLSTILYSTVFGSGDNNFSNISPVAFLVDTCQNVYISGWGGNLGVGAPTSNCLNMPTTSGLPAPLSTTTDGFDFYFIALSKNIQNLLLGAYFGRYSTNVGKGEHVDGGTSRFDKNGVIYQAICGGCYGSGGTTTAFPTTAGSWSPTNQNSNCNEACLKIAFNIGSVNAVASANPNSKGCPPFTVQFQNTSSNASSYFWDFGDGTPANTTTAPQHTFYNQGVYHVMLAAYNPNACKIKDTTYLTITVDSNHIQAGFSFIKKDSCNPYSANFINSSTYGTTVGASSFTKFIWNFGDGTSYFGTTPPLHTYATLGSYIVSLIMIDSTSCNNPDTIKKTITFIDNVHALSTPLPSNKGCYPFKVTFQNNSLNAANYLWNFGDGSPTDTAKTPVHTFLNHGTYHVVLYAFNSNACKTKDTAYLTIIVDSNSIKSGFSIIKKDSCGPYSVNITNTSTFSTTPGASIFTQFYWNFGDGTTYVGANPPLHSFPSAANYTVSLIMYDSTSCNKYDTLRKVVNFLDTRVKAAFSALDSVCIYDAKDIKFTNNSTNFATLLWSFGDGQTTNSTAPTHTYTTPGIYTITLIAYNPNAICNKIDSIKKTIKINSKPIANFDFTPISPQPNTPIQYNNLSTNAVTYFWTFGDGSTSTEKNPNHLFKKTGKFRTCLQALSAEGCIDSVCKSVDAEINTLMDVPSGFSPNGDGKNDILYVRGAGIETVNFKIYNRWGQKVFESNNLNIGWDGSFNGKQQEMEVYAFVVTAVFIDGTTLTKKGNVTLLR